MEFPHEIREYVEELAAGRKDLPRAVELLSQRYRGESGSGKPLLNGDLDVLAYAAVRMPATFGAASKVLELTLNHFNGDICSILDAGAGTGAASLAAYLLTGCGDVTCVECDQGMINMGAKLSKRCVRSARACFNCEKPTGVPGSIMTNSLSAALHNSSSTARRPEAVISLRQYADITKSACRSRPPATSRLIHRKSARASRPPFCPRAGY